MDIQYDTTVKLTPDDLAEMVAKKIGFDLGNNFTIDLKNVRFVVEEEYQGFGTGEHKVYVFTGVEVKADFIRPIDRNSR